MTLRSGGSRAFSENIGQAVKALQTANYADAQEHIKGAMLGNLHAPEVQNLLGLLAELTGDLSLAGKHYRAAYALDPTYIPARRNLQRVTTFPYKIGEIPPDFGSESGEEEILPYILEYDDQKVGHLRKKEKEFEKA